LYIESLTLENLRCFAQAKIRFSLPSTYTSIRLPNVNLLLGNNGSGKTTVLRAIALATLSAAIDQSGFVPYYLVRENQKKAVIRGKILLHQQDHPDVPTDKSRTEDVVTRLERIGDREILESDTKANRDIFGRIYEDNNPSFFVLGYGANRRVDASASVDIQSRQKSRAVRYQRVSGMFEDHVTLIPLASWLPQLRNGSTENDIRRYQELVDMLHQLLPEELRLQTDVPEEISTTSSLNFLYRGIPLPYEALSDGYKSYLSWIGDLLWHLNSSLRKTAETKLNELSGVVMVDEIDLHLHPEWQRTVISQVANALPNMQFIFTTHSPLVTGVVPPENIYVMEVSANGASQIIQYEEDVYGMTMDRILHSAYFDLDTVRPPSLEDELLDLALKAGAGDKDAAILYMKKLAGQSKADL
jgi:predicted ATP-binding protein involved in virulence